MPILLSIGMAPNTRHYKELKETDAKKNFYSR